MSLSAFRLCVADVGLGATLVCLGGRHALVISRTGIPLVSDALTHQDSDAPRTWVIDHQAQAADCVIVGIAYLGPLIVNEGAVRLGSRDRTVLTALAMRPGEVLSAERLADAVWHDMPPASWHKNLQGCVARLRKALGPKVIVTSPHGYRLVVPADAVDGQVFERAVARGREQLTIGSAEHAAFTLRGALALWRGRALMDLEEWEPASHYAERLEELRRDAQELWLGAALQAGHHDEVLAEAQTMVRAMPLRERRWQLLALAQYQSGRQGDALETLHDLRQVLVAELGLDAGPEIVALEQAMLRQEPALLVEPARANPEEECPYQGLTPYDVTDAEGFFGRDADVAACLERLHSTGVVAVVGPSGSGKSSLVRAGIAATLVRDGRSFTTIVPGSDPLHTLGGLDGRPRDSILILDQCEEVFSLSHDAADQRAFLDWVVEYAQNAPVVVALRADRMGDVSGHPGFAGLVERGLFLLAAMNADCLLAAIQGPAQQAGLVVEPGLADLLVREVENEPGALPLLSHVLRETWVRREGRTLTVGGYQASGGIRGAVAQSAENVYRTANEGERRALRDMFLRLVTPGADGEPLRSRVPKRHVANTPAQDRLIDLLVATRLVTSDEDVVELAHEALTRAWPRLASWLQDDLDGQRILHHLTNAADAWNSLGRPDSELYRGTRLAQADEWRSKSAPDLTQDEAAFLDRADAVARTEQRAVRDRARAQGLMIRRLRLVLIGAVVFLFFAVTAGVLAVVQKRTADVQKAVAQENAATALREATAADARRAGARALVSKDIAESMLLAVAGVRLDDSPETRSSLLATIARHPELVASTPMSGLRVIYLDVSPDGHTVATYDAANRVRLFDIATGRLLAQYQAGTRAQPTWVSGKAVFSPDGKYLAVLMAAPTRRPVTILRARTLKPLRVQPSGPPRMRWQVDDMTYSGDGRHLAVDMWRVQGRGSTLRTTSSWAAVWDLASPQRPTTRIRVGDGAGVALSNDGRVLFTTNPLTIHHLTTGDADVVDDAQDVGRLTMSPNGRILAGSTPEGNVLLDPENGKLRRRLQGTAADGGFIVNFSGDGSRVATVTFENPEALVWDVSTGALLSRLPLGENGSVVDFGADRSTVYTAGAQSSLRQWDSEGDRRFISTVALAPTELGDDSFVQPAPGGDLVAYPNVSDQGTQPRQPSASHVSFFDVSARKVVATVDRGQGYRPLHGEGGWHPDGVHYALATGAEIRIWNARTGKLTQRARPVGPRISAIDFSTDGSRLVIAEPSGRVSMLDSTTLTMVGHPAQLDEATCCVAAGPDNHTAIVLTGELDTAGFTVDSITGWALVDLRSGEVVRQGRLPMEGTQVVAVSPDGKQAAIGGKGGELLVLNTQTGEPLRSPVVGHDSGVTTVAYSSDGDRILTTGLDANVGLWDSETGLQLARVVAPQRPIAAEFRADPESVIIAPLWEGPIYKWNTRTGYAIRFACSMAGRDFTQTEWKDHFGTRPYQQTCPP